MTTPNPVDTPEFTAKPYPPGPYGFGIGDVIPPYEFLGWKDPSEAGQDLGKLETLSLADYYNPDGTKPVKVLFVDSSAVWCPPCNDQYKEMDAPVCRKVSTTSTIRKCYNDVECTSNEECPKFYDYVKPKGIELFGTLMEDNDGNPVKLEDLVNWTEPGKYDVHFPFAADPSFKLGPLFIYDAVPSGTIVNTQTMTIVNKHPGGGSDLKTLLAELENELW